ncbi:MAG: uracil-DNA glycosylase [Hyphomicrobiaceae bacterium]
MDNAARELARDLLAWYRAAGVDEAVEETAIDWTLRGETAPGGDMLLEPPVSEGKAPAPPRATSNPAPQPRGIARSTPAPSQRQFASPAPDQSVAEARKAARAAPTLEALEQELRRFDGCALKATAKNLCFYRGAAKSRLMLIGEAPGRDEDIEGRPFVGRAGQLLDKMLAATGLKESDVHITNIVYWRPPGNRTPSLLEVQACRPFVERQIELVEPDIILLLGGAAAKSLLGVEEGIMRLRGKWREMEFGERKIRVMATLHPAYLLRTPVQKRLAWRDMLAVAAALEGDGKGQAAAR